METLIPSSLGSESCLCRHLPGPSASNWEMGKVTLVLLSWWSVEKAGGIPAIGLCRPVKSGVPGSRHCPVLWVRRAPCSVGWVQAPRPPRLSPSSSGSSW